MMNERERIGARIAELRKSLGMTQEELAGKCGLQRTTVSKIERGRFSVSVDMLSRICEVLGSRLEIAASPTKKSQEKKQLSSK